MKNIRVVQVGPDHSVLLAPLHGTGFSTSWTCDGFAAPLKRPGVAAWLCNSDVSSAVEATVMARAL